MIYIMGAGLAYLLGSISSAVLVCKLLGLPDPRTVGSNNPGATNVMRVGGKKAAYLTFVGDALKGFIPVAVARYFFTETDGYTWISLTSLVALCAFLGHLYPIFFGFKGGKGIATLVGILLALHSLTALVFGVIWLVLYKLSRMVSLASMLALLLVIPINYYWLKRLDYVLLLALLLVLVLYRHRSNIVDIYHGRERRFDAKK